MNSRVRLEGLRIHAGETELVCGVSLELEPGQVLVLVGASGSGKTLTARSLLGLVDARPGVVGGELLVEVDGVQHRPYAQRGWRAQQRAFRPLRGGVLGYLPQNARASLDPLRTVGRQVSMALRLADRDQDPLPWLQKAGFSDALRVAGLYPHELSGGMAQRASIALALGRGSQFLLADEPTTGLDPTVREAILAELLALRDLGVGVLLITHDLRLVPRVGDRLLVMHAGLLVEDLPADQLDRISAPQAKALWNATARISGGALS